MALDPGMILGAFEITSLLGRGGMGEVYAARDRKLGRDVAIKILPEYFAADAERLARFEREAQTLAALNHPNIATVYGFEHDEGRGLHYLVMEHIDGGTLGERIEAGPLSVSALLPIFIDIARGLDAAHEAGIVHRDLKPDNVKINAAGVVKILDFGLAKGDLQTGPTTPDAPTTPIRPLAVTAEGTFLGTPSYMSPEQARGKEVDRRTDIWAFGCCLYQALTGDIPFKGDTIADTVGAILERNPDWSKLPKDTPREIRSLLRRCLEKDPRKRFSSAGDMAYILEEYRDHLRHEVHRPSTIQTPAPTRRAAWIPIAAGALLAIAGVTGGIVWGLLGRTSDSDTATQSARAAITSLAVLPLENLMNDPEQDYFVDGMTEAITAELSKISSLKVISRTSTMHYKNTDLRAPQIAEELGVTGLIEGSVLRQGDNVRITVQLIDAVADAHLWADSYEGTLDNIFKLHSDVALAIANEIRTTVSPDEQDRIEKSQDVDPEAYDLYLKGLSLADETNPEGFTQALDYLDRSIAIEPGFADAWAWKAGMHIRRANFNVSEPAEQMKEAKHAAEMALQLDDKLAVAYESLGSVRLFYELDWPAAKELYDRAIALDPNSPSGYIGQSWLQLFAGRFDKAADYASRSLSSDPNSSTLPAYEGCVMSLAGQPEQGLEIIKELLEREPHNYLANLMYGYNLVRAGQYEKGLEVVERIGIPAATVYLRLGQRDRAEAMFQDQLAQADEKYVAPAFQANYYRAKGDLEKAFEWYKRAAQAPSIQLLLGLTFTPWEIENDESVQRFLQDQRYWELRERLNFPPLPAEHPAYKYEQEWRAQRAAKAMLAKQGVGGSPRIESLAVLPMRDLSPQGEQDYFAESMTDAITAELAKIKALKIRGRTSAMQYKDTDLKIPEIAKALDVDVLIEGSVTREGDEVRINVTLQDGATDTQLWTGEYEETITSVLKLQSDVALAIADAVNAQITGEERKRIATTRKVDPKAHEAYVLGQYLYRTAHSREVYEQAIRQLEAAVKIEPQFAEAWMALGTTYIDIADEGFAPQDESKSIAREAFQKAIEIDPGAGEAYSGLTEITLAHDFDWEAARRFGERAVSLAPSSAFTQVRYAEYLESVGRVADAVRYARETIALDKGNTVPASWARGILIHWGAIEEVRAWADAARAAELDDPDVLYESMNVYSALGLEDEALNLNAKFLHRTQSDPDTSALQAAVLARFGRQDDARTVLAKVLQADRGDQDLRWIARTYVELADLDSAFEWYKKARERKLWFVRLFKGQPYMYGNIDRPAWKAFRADDRYWKFCDEMKFPPFPPDHPGYADEQRWMAKKAARKMLAEQGATPKPVKRYSINLPTANLNSTFGFPVISPDGANLAYSVWTITEPNVHVWSIGTAKERVIPDKQKVWTKFFSPDSKSLGYIEEQRGTVGTVDLQTGATRSLTEAPDNWGGTWGPDDTVVYVPDQNAGLWQISTGGGSPVQLTEPDTKRGESHYTPCVLPDGRHVLFTIRTGPRQDDLTVALLSLADRTITPVIEHAMDARYAPTGHVVFARDGDLWAVPFDLASCSLNGAPALILKGVQMDIPDAMASYSFSDTGTLVYLKPDAQKGSLIWIDREGRETELLPDQRRAPYSGAVLSPQGRRLAIVELGPTKWDIWIVDIARGARTRIKSDGNQGPVVWAPDGKSIIFSSDDDGIYNLYREKADGTGTKERITKSPLNGYVRSVSQEGLIAFYQYDGGGGRNIWTVSSEPDAVPAPFLSGPEGYEDPQIHPGGKWIAYVSDVSGQYEVYSTSFPKAGARNVISVAGGAVPRWSPKGDELFYVEDNKLMVVDVTIEGDVLNAGIPTPLLEKDFGETYHFQDVDADAERFLVIKTVSATTELSVIENWFEELKRLAPLSHARGGSGLTGLFDDLL